MAFEGLLFEADLVGEACLSCDNLALQCHGSPLVVLADIRFAQNCLPVVFLVMDKALRSTRASSVPKAVRNMTA